MSHTDAALLSPSDSTPWDSLYADSFSHYYLPPSPSSSSTSNSPIPTSTMLKMRLSPDSTSDPEQLCLPTHQLFDFPEKPLSSTQERLSVSINPSAVAAPSSSTSSKRSASPAPSATKKPRAAGERISSKDFIPPDVSGLSKREARLVKNRAAAFLSRQRKREEFELMEVRVAELEQENARLLALAQGNISTPFSTDNELVSQVENLKAQLAAAQERERQLNAELVSKSTTAAPDPPIIKIEDIPDQQLSPPPSRSSPPAPHKSAASLGLMVLLCALPTLLSMPMQSALPTSFALPNPPFPSSTAFDFNSFLPNDYDWARTSGSLMDLDDLDLHPAMTSSASSTATSRHLELSTSDVLDADAGLGELDISFDANPTDTGKIRVRIHPSSSASSRAASPGLSDSNTPSDLASLSPQSFASLSPLTTYPPPLSPGGDPFLGGDYSMPYLDDPLLALSSGGAAQEGSGYTQDGSEYGYPSGEGGAKRRVRIALKSLPAAGGEGGEWEVQIC